MYLMTEPRIVFWVNLSLTALRTSLGLRSSTPDVTTGDALCVTRLGTLVIAAMTRLNTQLTEALTSNCDR